ncbi:hypothetical protein GCM10027440_36490 [Nocardiopsis coralliicola]
MSGLSIVPYVDIDSDSTEYDIYSPKLLSSAQCMGDACAICHARWPRPRHALGELAGGGLVFGCAECAGIIAAHEARTKQPELAAR